MTMNPGRTAVLALIVTAGAAWAEPARFDTPEAGFAAVMAALEAHDRAEILRIFGPEQQDILSTGVPEEDREIWTGFYEDASAFHEIVEEVPGQATLYFGRGRLVFPFPLTLKDGAWVFDGEVAREEIRIRRIGRNELAVIDILGRVPEIQATYRSVDHDGDGVMEFAAAILSSPDGRDGLFWPEEEGTEPSPYGEAIARASLTGYAVDGADQPPEPLEGYLFTILQGQGPAAPGGAYSYLVGGNMVAGHAVAAFPAVYGDTGVMSFIVGENGVVYEADLGEETLVRAGEISVFDPGEGWTVVEPTE
jgi:Protein of unknown function (DUF2950)